MNSQSDRFPQKEPATGAPNTFVEIRWIARKLRPAVLLQVLLVFLTFMMVSQFVFQSTNSLKSLALAAVASVVALLPQVLSRIEYRASETGLEWRLLGKTDSESFKQLFLWDELDHAAFVKHGIKYMKNLADTNPTRRFLKKQFSDRYSGEIRVEAGDRNRVRELLLERGVSVRCQ